MHVYLYWNWTYSIACAAFSVLISITYKHLVLRIKLSSTLWTFYFDVWAFRPTFEHLVPHVYHVSVLRVTYYNELDHSFTVVPVPRVNI